MKINLEFIHPSQTHLSCYDETMTTVVRIGNAFKAPSQVSFDRAELSLILNVYGQMVSKGDWKDYAIDFLQDRCVFSVFRKASEHPLYRIEKVPALRNRQGQFSVVAPGGLILKRGHDLKQVLRVFDRARFRQV